MVARVKIKNMAAANAESHPDSQLARLENLIWKIRFIKAFKTEKQVRILPRVFVVEARRSLQRRDEMKAVMAKLKPISTIRKTWTGLTSLACFRGFSAYLIMGILQWCLALVIDFFLSGQPSEFKLGYGSTSIVLATIFASNQAVWTHCTLTKPSNKKTFSHFLNGGKLLIELWPLTCSWAVAEHITISCPLALSRAFELKPYAFDVDSWGTLDEAGQKAKIAQFCQVFLLYLLLVACLSVPATMTLRRVHASMLSDEDLAIVPFIRSVENRTQPYYQKQGLRLRSPGLTVPQAFYSITRDDYFRTLLVYVQYFAVNQLVQMTYWSAKWKLHEFLEVDKYASVNLPCSPAGRVPPLSAGNSSALLSLWFICLSFVNLILRTAIIISTTLCILKLSFSFSSRTHRHNLWRHIPGYHLEEYVLVSLIIIQILFWTSWHRVLGEPFILTSDKIVRIVLLLVLVLVLVLPILVTENLTIVSSKNAWAMVPYKMVLRICHTSLKQGAIHINTFLRPSVRPGFSRLEWTCVSNPGMNQLHSSLILSRSAVLYSLATL